MQVRFELIYMNKISYLIVHLHEKAWKDASFDMTLERKEESDSKDTRCTWKALEKE